MMNRGPVGAPNSHEGPRMGDLRRGDKIKPSTGWRTVSHVAVADGVVVVSTVEGETVVGRSTQRMRHAVRDRDRDDDGWRSCPVDGTRHNLVEFGRYCSAPCLGEAMGGLCATSADAARWVAEEWRAVG